LADAAKKLPVGRLYGNGRAFVPNVRQDLYSKVVAALSAEPQGGASTGQEAVPVATGLPLTWDEIAAGHLVIAQETLALGWWEAIVINRKDDMFTLRFRDYPKIPKFVRHRSAIALMSPAAEWAARGPGPPAGWVGRRPSRTTAEHSHTEDQELLSWNPRQRASPRSMM
jgi:hypothetical protein